MAGAYCTFCGQRCFVSRIVPGGPYMGTSWHMATCPEGKNSDAMAFGGYNADSSLNPVTDEIPAEVSLRGQAHHLLEQGFHGPGASDGTGTRSCEVRGHSFTLVRTVPADGNGDGARCVATVDGRLVSDGDTEPVQAVAALESWLAGLLAQEAAGAREPEGA